MKIIRPLVYANTENNELITNNVSTLDAAGKKIRTKDE